ncbi:tRNA(fMet)-specific endonuclease VapC [Novosphingobium hassiacum]|uniref:tRNA(fMet)-specific endonuclease VapC n=2 Tax=Novosphingobium hassiacum TaxID=173676 RepID=A0A7W5ZT06_9SPHN|nr:tRNA(fMet)-specific endonuclease VapC [Novosphingobium hassiacum]
MLDSNVVIAVALAAGESVRQRMAEHDEGDFVISSIAFAEVMRGSVQGKPPTIDRLQALIEEVPVLAFDENAAQAYAKIPFKRASYDRLIAAHALSLGLTVITGNTKDFADVPGLVVENWTV